MDQFQLRFIAPQVAMLIGNGPHQEIGHLQEIRFPGADMLYSANHPPVKIAKVVRQDLLQEVDLELAVGILDIQIDVVLNRRGNDVAQQIEIHFVVEGIVAPLVVIPMVQFCLVLYNETPEIEISRGEKKTASMK